MQPLRLIRELRLRDIEAFQIRRGYGGETVCFVVVVDFGRPSKIDDFPWVKGIEDEEGFGRSNFIQGIVLHSKPIEKVDNEEIMSLVGAGFLENKDDCDWNAVFDLVEPQTFERALYSKADRLRLFEGALKARGVTVQLGDIDEAKFNRLSQD